MDNARPLNEKSSTPPNPGEKILAGKVRTAEETDPDPGDETKIGLSEEVDDCKR